jgi:adenine phosphoribosyltransferase
MTDISKYIRDVPDFPKPGIIFKDITPLLTDPVGFKATVDQLCEPFKGKEIDLCLGVEARGFLFAAAAAYQLDAGVTIVRKPGKLPYTTVEESYELEYGTDTLQMHTDAIQPGQKVLVLDDLIATGGTVEAVKRMIEKAGGEIVSFAFVVELDFLHGRDKLGDANIHSLLHY